MIQSILYGNGINRVSVGIPSWDELVKEISDVKLDKNIPNPLKYEALLMKKPYREPSQRSVTNDGKDIITNDGKRLYASGQLTEKTLKDQIAKRLSSFEKNDVYDAMAKLPVTHFITTNYDNTLFASLGKGSLNKRFREEKIYSIRRNYLINSSNGGPRYYWPIHGNIDSPASIMLGFDHYCGSLAKIEQYVKGGYDLHGSRLESISIRLKQGIDEIISWVDLFFISDIHIIGLGLGYEETDLWWVLNKRRRIKQAIPENIRNRIFYYPVDTVNEDIEQLLNSFDVEVVSLEQETIGLPYLKKYSLQLVAIENYLNSK